MANMSEHVRSPGLLTDKSPPSPADGSSVSVAPMLISESTIIRSPTAETMTLPHNRASCAAEEAFIQRPDADATLPSLPVANPLPEQAQCSAAGELEISSGAPVADCPHHSADASAGASEAVADPQEPIENAQAAADVQAAAADDYEGMLQHLRQPNPPIVGVRFELLMDGSPDQLRGQCGSQLHVVVVRQVAWPARHYIACFRLVALLSFKLFVLSYLFGPITGIIALYLLNSERFVQQFAGLVVGTSQRQHDQHLQSFVFLSFVCLAIVPLGHHFFDEFWLLRIIIWFLEKLFGVMLIALAYSCVVNNDLLDKVRFRQARSTLVMLSFHLIALILLRPLATDPWTLSLTKVSVLAALTLKVYREPAKFYFLCCEWFEIPGLPVIHEPSLFVFNTVDITRVLQLRHDIRTRSESVQRLGIAHVQRGHVDNVCVGHLTTERWGSILVHPALYNSPACRRALFLSYTYVLPLLNVLYFFVNPSEPVARTFAFLRQSFNNDFIISVLNLLRACVASLLGILGWGLGLFCADFFSSLHACAEWVFNQLAHVSEGIAALDQWVSYFVARFAPLKNLLGMMVRPVQDLCLWFSSIFGFFCHLLARILPHITVARIVPNSAANADVVGRWLLSGWIRDMWQRLCSRCAVPAASRTNSTLLGQECAAAAQGTSPSQSSGSALKSSTDNLKKNE